jgi:hypothetical protein
MARSFAEIFESFPPELRAPIARLAEALQEELRVTKSDFTELRRIVQELAEAQKQTGQQIRELVEAQKRTEHDLEDLKQVVRELAEAQKRTEHDLEDLKQVVRELAEAQKRTEQQVRELAEAQKRTEQQVRELAEAQKRTEHDLEDLKQVVRELAEAQKRTEGAVRELADTQAKFGRTFHSQMGALGARWGLQAEGAFREGMRTILQEVGFVTERFSVKDSAGEALGYPEQIELDIIVKNGKLIVTEIKSSIDREHTAGFNKKVAFYTRKTGRQVDRKLIIAPHVEIGTQELAHELGVEVCTDVNELA